MPPRSPKSLGEGIVECECLLKLIEGKTINECLLYITDMKQTDFKPIRGVYPVVREIAAELQREITSAELCLWCAIKSKRLRGLKFRRQHAVGRFILDFYCPTHKLVLEVDGGIHNQQQDYDAARTEHLEAYGYQVIRFKNEEVLDNLPAVLEQILVAIDQIEMCEEETTP